MHVNDPRLAGEERIQIIDILEKYRPDLPPYEEVYREIHQNPELSCQEKHTAHIAAGHLKSLNFSVHESIGGYGVVGLLDNGQGRTVMLRSELDALPLLEQTGLSYASTRRMVDADGEEKPVMHACGHDMHIASLMAAATLLEASKKHWAGRLIVLFQPNEERGGGARAMVMDGLYSGGRIPVPNVLLGQHLVKAKAGSLQLGAGYALAGKQTFRIIIHGRGGHVSGPQFCIDPVVIACYIVIRLQTVASREVDPNRTLVISCGSVRAGDAPNIIPDKAEILVDIRAYAPEVLNQAVDAVKRIVKAECDASGTDEEPEIIEIEHVPPLVNSNDVMGPLERQFREVFGGHAIEKLAPGMASDDFTILAPKGVPYAYWTLGGTDPDTWEEHRREGDLDRLPVNHSPKFAPAINPTLKVAVDAWATAALTFLDIRTS
ncbi:putative zinc metallopeptidase [Xylariaceae sp. FL1651]|nr:putative zinc metallopeptidase [Xylariaceae sp. FL1651]